MGSLDGQPAMRKGRCRTLRTESSHQDTTFLSLHPKLRRLSCSRSVIPLNPERLSCITSRAALPLHKACVTTPLDNGGPSGGPECVNRTLAAEGVAQLLQAEFQACLHCAKGRVQGGSDFSLAHAIDKRQANGLPLRMRKKRKVMFENVTHVRMLVLTQIFFVIRTLWHCVFHAFLGMAVGQLSANRVYSAPTAKGVHPCEGFALARIVAFCPAPEFDKAVLQNVINGRIVIHCSNNHAPEKMAMAAVKKSESFRVAFLNGGHQDFIGWL